MTLDDWHKVEKAAYEDFQKRWGGWSTEGAVRAWNNYKDTIKAAWLCVELEPGQETPGLVKRLV